MSSSTLKHRIIKKIAIYGGILIVAIYSALYFVNIEKSKTFNKEQIEITLSTLSYLDKELKIDFLKKYAEINPYVKDIYFDDSIIHSRTGEELIKVSKDGITISYLHSAVDNYVEGLEFRMAIVAVGFYILVFLINIMIGNLLNPFNEIVKYFESFNEFSPSVITFKDTKVAHEFKVIQLAIEKVVLKLKSHEEKLKRNAREDSLTGLRNRRAYFEDIQSVIEGHTILFLDLDGFKEVNDSMGHEAGDTVLKEVSDRLQSIASDHKFRVYRFGGDEFLILLRSCDNHVVERFCESVTGVIKRDFFYNSSPIKITTSIGISRLNLLDHDISIVSADIAMYEAKKLGKNQYVFFEPKMLETARAKVQLIKDIGEAAVAEDFDFVLQPQVDEEGKILGAEALIRWNKDGKQLAPYIFINELENSKYMIPVGNKLIENVFMFSKNLNKELFYTINLSEIQLENEYFLMDMISILEKTEINPSQFEFEITERWNSIDSERISLNLKGLKKLGFKLSIDDFGEDQSSFNRSDLLPIDKLKLDKSFADRIVAWENNSRNAVQSIFQYTQLSGLDIIAEGVETFDQLEAFKKIGVKKFQGYFFYKPMSKELFLEEAKDSAFII